MHIREKKIAEKICSVRSYAASEAYQKNKNTNINGNQTIAAQEKCSIHNTLFSF